MTEFDYTGGDALENMTKARNYNAYLMRMLRRGLEDARTVLDFGAGTGQFAVEVARLGYDVRCVEPAGQNRRRLAAAGLPAHPDLDAIGDASIDFVYSLNVLEHIENDAGALHSLRTKLRPGGGLLLYVPAFESLYSSFDRRVGHVRRYRRRALADLVERTGFRVQSADYVDCLGFVAAAAYKLLDNGQGELTSRSVIAYDRAVFPLSRLLSPIFAKLFGKNVLLVARRD